MAPPQRNVGVGFVAQIVGLGCFGVAAFVIGALLLFVFIVELGLPGFIIAVVMAFVPATVYLTIVLLIDRFDPEPWWVLLLAFVWGGVIAIFGALIINDTATLIATQQGGQTAGEFVGAVISAPIAEEGFKGLGLLVLLLALRREFDGIVDGIVYACVIALGFATVENILYYGRGIQAGGAAGGAFLLVLRGLMAPFSHPLFTSMTGIGFGIAREQRKGFVAWTAPVAGYILAVLLHATWNFVATIAGNFGDDAVTFFFGVYFLGWVPAFLCFVAAIAYCLYRERKIIRQHLYEEVVVGVLSPEEFTNVTKLFKRMSFHMSGLRSGGFKGYRLATGFSRTATRLALSKWHTLKAGQKNAQTRSLSMVPVLRQQLTQYRNDLAALSRS